MAGPPLLACAADFPVPETVPEADLPDPPVFHRSEDTDDCAEDLMAAASAFSRTNFKRMHVSSVSFALISKNCEPADHLCQVTSSVQRSGHSQQLVVFRFFRQQRSDGVFSPWVLERVLERVPERVP